MSQVHLRNFYSPNLGNRLYAIRKSDLKTFTPDAKAICRIENGSTNPYVTEERAIEEFLKHIEPKYNAAVAAIADGDIDEDVIFVVSGFVSYILTCSPAAMRLAVNPLEQVIEES
ncbi:hypothetical protein, partial [Spectribacter hydrogenoxidans]